MAAPANLFYRLDERPIPRPRLSMVDGWWRCRATPGPGDYPAAVTACASEWREAYGRWLDYNALVHRGFKRYAGDVRPIRP
jgi:hypothetical protein